jgi:hypothetical protein
MRSRMESRVEERWLGPIWAAAMVMGRFGDDMLVVDGGIRWTGDGELETLEKINDTVWRELISLIMSCKAACSFYMNV